MNLNKAIICDLDGTLCDHTHRLHHVDPLYICKHPDYELVQLEPNARGMDWKNKITGKLWEEDYESYYSSIGEDKPNEWCAGILRFHQAYYKNVFITGRPEKYRAVTEKWVNDNAHILPRWKLFMRPDLFEVSDCQCTEEKMKTIGRCISCHMTVEGNEQFAKKKYIPDHRASHIVKQEIYANEIKGKYNVLFVLEDDPKCVEMYRGLGLTVLDCGR